MDKDQQDQRDPHELPWKIILQEAAFWWLLPFILWLWWESYPDGLWFRVSIIDAHNSIKDGFWWRNILPQSDHNGWGSLSYVSCMTGLNIAIVKLQSFLKAQEEVQRRWVERAVKRSEAKLPGLAVEEDVIPEFRKDVKKECQSCLDGINNDKMWCWSFWSRWAIRMSMIGFLCMAFQYSAGILVLPMAAPIVATWLLSRTIRDELFTEMSGVDRRLIPVYRDKLKKVANEKGKEAGAAIQEAEKAEQVAGAREGRS